MHIRSKSRGVIVQKEDNREDDWLSSLQYALPIAVCDLLPQRGNALSQGCLRLDPTFTCGEIKSLGHGHMLVYFVIKKIFLS